MGHNEKPNTTSEAAGASSVAALFDERTQAEVALSDLERGGIPAGNVGFALPASGAGEAESTGKEKMTILGAPTTGYPGWTMGMAPWTISGVGPLMLHGSLSLAHRKDRPNDLRALASSLGLEEEAAERIEAALRRKAVLVTVDAPEKETIATHILERNGGHVLPRK